MKTRPGRVGRPRSLEIEQAILAATLVALVEDGYDAMSIEGIAARAGAGKATVYRYWPTKAQLVVRALTNYAEAVTQPMFDTGDLRSDLRSFLTSMQAVLVANGPLLATFAVERMRHPELHEAFELAFVAERRQYLHQRFAGALERGELPSDADTELLADTGPAILWHRLTLSHQPLTADLPDRIVKQLLGDGLPASGEPCALLNPCNDRPPYDLTQDLGAR